ncbi:unnamed protein product [Camellia sinensis]
MIRCVCEEEKPWLSKKKKQSVVVVKASVAASESSNVLKTSNKCRSNRYGLSACKGYFYGASDLKVVTKPRPWKLHPQMLIERGCFMVLESYFSYFNSLSQSSDQGDVIGYVPHRNSNADIWDGVACHVYGFKISQRKRFTAPPFKLLWTFLSQD